MKAEGLDVNEYLDLSASQLVIDVRSPVEYDKGHIPGAVNIPLFEDVERAEIGTLYKLKGKEEAVMRGLEIVSPKLTHFIREAKQNTQSNNVYVYCFRGGMRSNSFGWLLNTAGLNARILNGGYKAYRNHVLKNFEREYKLILLGGPTGSGKTELLQELKKHMQVIDLEKLANHKGSAFGSIGQEAQLPQQLFENNLHIELEKQDTSKFILLEDESMSIGYNKIPYPFWLQMKRAPIIKINVPFELRVKRLVNDYGTAPVEQLKKSVKNISSQIGPDNAKKCLELLDHGGLAEVAAITLGYYDRAYEYNHFKRNYQNIISIDTDTDDLGINTLKIKDALEQYGNS
jgi:tRNA 2-selenouridine synthase